jgi:hypothetical protein
VVAAFSTVPLLASFRQILLDALVRRGMPRNMTWSAPICEPAIQAFLKIADDMMLLEALKALWFRQVKSLGRKECRNAAVLTRCFSAAVLQLWPLLGDSQAPLTEVELFATEASYKARLQRVQAFVNNTPEATVIRNSEGILFRPFTIAETTYTGGP